MGLTSTKGHRNTGAWVCLPSNWVDETRSTDAVSLLRTLTRTPKSVDVANPLGRSNNNSIGGRQAHPGASKDLGTGCFPD